MIEAGRLRHRDTLPEFLFYGGLLVAFSLVMPIRFNAWVIIGVSAAFITYTIRSTEPIKPVFKSAFFILISVHMAVQLLGLLHTTDLKMGYREIERYAYALLLPVLVYCMGKAGMTVRNLVWAFAAGCLLLSVYGLAYVGLVVDEAERRIIFSEGHTSLTDHMAIHPTYLSIYLTFVFCCVLEILRADFYRLSKLRRVLVAVVPIFVVVMVFAVRSQFGLLIFVSMTGLYLLITLRRRAALVGFFLVIAGVLTYFIDAGRVRTFFDDYGRNVSTALDNRLVIWKASLRAIGTAPLAGAGTGGAQVNLNSAYAAVGYQEGLQNSYNAHNQYLEFAVRNGIPELLAFLALLVYGFYRSLSYSNHTYLMFNMIFSIAMIAESCLTVHKGIVFFYFFASAFAYLPFDREKSQPPVAPA